MDKDTVMKELNEIFVQVLGTPDLQLTADLSADDIDEWDSLTNMTIVSEIEKHWGVKFKLRDIIRMKNIGDMVDTILKKA